MTELIQIDKRSKKNEETKYACFATQTVFMCEKCNSVAAHIESIMNACGEYKWLCRECMESVGRQYNNCEK